jgi:hypothetical protein
MTLVSPHLPSPAALPISSLLSHASSFDYITPSSLAFAEARHTIMPIMRVDALMRTRRLPAELRHGELALHQITSPYDHLIRSVQYNRRNLDLANALVPAQAGKARHLHFLSLCRCSGVRIPPPICISVLLPLSVLLLFSSTWCFSSFSCRCLIEHPSCSCRCLMEFPCVILVQVRST